MHVVWRCKCTKMYTVNCIFVKQKICTICIMKTMSGAKAVEHINTIYDSYIYLFILIHLRSYWQIGS